MKPSFQRFISWLLVALAGHAALLDLISPGAWALGLRPPAEAFAEHRVAIACLTGVALVVFSGARKLLAAALLQFGKKRVALFVAVWTVVTTLVARSAGVYAWSFAIIALSHTANFGALVLAQGAMPFSLSKIRRALPWTCALIASAATLLISFSVFDALPHVPDDVAYVFQAKTYAAGIPFRDAPPEAALFEQTLIPVVGGKWFSIFPPGWPLVLAVGMLAGIPWIVNPLLAGAAVLVAHALVRRRMARAAADVCAVMLAFSPTFLFISSTYMSHTLSIVCALVALLAADLAAARRSKSGRYVFATLSGAAAGLLFLTRPIEGIVIGAVLLAYVLSIGRRRLPWAVLGTGAVTAGAVMSLWFINNRLLTGDALVDPVQQYFNRTFHPGSNALGFGPTRGIDGWANNILPGHGLVEAAIHVNINSSLADTELFGWSFGSMLFVLLFFAVGGLPRAAGWLRRTRGKPACATLFPWVAIPVLTLIANSLYWYSGADLGPRYWSQCIVPFAVLSARGAFLAADKIGIDRARAGALLLLATVSGAALVVPWRAATKYNDYRGVVGDLRALRRVVLGDGDLVLIRTRSHGNERIPFSDFGPAIILNEIPLERGAIFARSGDHARVERLKKFWPTRDIWVVDAPSLTMRGYKVVQGPDRARAYLP